MQLNIKYKYYAILYHTIPYYAILFHTMPYYSINRNTLKAYKRRVRRQHIQYSIPGISKAEPNRPLQY